MSALCANGQLGWLDNRGPETSSKRHVRPLAPSVTISKARSAQPTLALVQPHASLQGSSQWAVTGS